MGNRVLKPRDDADRETAADERDRVADVREAALEVRESVAESVLAADDDRCANARKILDEAVHRDEVSDARDAEADDREGAEARAAFLDHRPNSSRPEVRRAAALDRRHSKSDRASAATDREELAGEDPADPGRTTADQ